jgi:membrane protease YdiL (CAAX protease family)
MHSGDLHGSASKSGSKILLGLAVGYAVLQGTATLLGSDRGQAGLWVGALVVATAVTLQTLFFERRPGSAARSLGLGWPASRGPWAALAIAVALLAVASVHMHLVPTSATLHPGWTVLLPGLFAQAGVAEEVLFRGYLFGNLRRQRPFWHAATLSMLPFVLVHLPMFIDQPWTIALAAIALAVVMSFPLARLFELGGNTIWAPALLHFVVQATPKLLQMDPAPGQVFALVWMAACATIPYLVFLWPQADARQPGQADA